MKPMLEQSVDGGKGYDDQDKASYQLLRDFDRWPTWMWSNREVGALLDWLKR